MILYHGSSTIVDKPLYGFGKVHNDYGQGFYCTEDIELAREWASQAPEGGFVNRYELDFEGMKVLDLSKLKLVSWIAMLLDNRVIRYSSPIERMAADYIINAFLPVTEGYDLITGYRADDSYFSYARAFLSNTISLQQLGIAVRLGNLGTQVCLKSPISFEALRFEQAEPVDGEIYYPKRMERDNKARNEYYRLLEEETADGIYIRDIINKEMTFDEFSI